VRHLLTRHIGGDERLSQDAGVHEDDPDADPDAEPVLVP